MTPAEQTTHGPHHGHDTEDPTRRPTSVVVGTLATDPVIRYSREGVAHTRFVVHIARLGNHTAQLTVCCEGDLAENVALSLTKGQPVVVVGTLGRDDTFPGPEAGGRVCLVAEVVGPSLVAGIVDWRGASPATVDQVPAEREPEAPRRCLFEAPADEAVTEFVLAMADDWDASPEDLILAAHATRTDTTPRPHPVP